MSATIIYDGNEIGNLEGGQTATLNCEGQVMRSNLVIEHNGVESVNGKTGAVTLTASDVGAVSSVYFEEYEEDFADMQTTVRDKLDKTTYNALLNKAETWTFTLADGSTVTKKVVLA